jgi:hypothetical protein
MEVNSYDYTVDKKKEGDYRLKRTLMICAYVLYCLVFLVLIIWSRIVPLGALIPFTLYIIYLCTWRFVSIEYKYTVESGLLTLYTVYGSRNKKKMAEIRLKEAKRIVPVHGYESEIKDFAPKQIYDGRSSKESADGYAILYHDGEIPAVIYLDAPEQSVKVLHYYNPDNTVKIKKGI